MLVGVSGGLGDMLDSFCSFSGCFEGVVPTQFSLLRGILKRRLGSNAKGGLAKT